MQPLEDIFSSPEKTATMNINMYAARTPSINGAQYSEEDDDSDDLPMDIENSMSASCALLLRHLISNTFSVQQPPQIRPA